MAFKLKIKRGTAAPSNTALDVAELGFDTTGKKLYVGNGSGVAASGVSMDGHAHSADDITSGTLSIDRIPTITVAKGGTNITSYTSGDILYASGTTTLSKLGIGSTGQILTVVGGAPAWANAGTAAQVANNLVLKFDTGTTEGTDLYTFNGSAAKTIDIQGGDAIGITKTSNTIVINHDDTSTQSSITASGRTYITGVTLDTYGHVTALTTGTETVTDTNTTYAISTEAGDDAYSEKIRLTAGGSGSGTDDVIIAVGQTGSVYGLAIGESGDTITLTHADTSALSGAQGSAGIASFTLDSMGHVTAVTTATYLTAESDTLDSVTGRGATTSNNITVGDIAVNGGDITTNQGTFNIGNTATSGTLTTNIAANAMTTGTKTVNIGTGSTGGTTAINIGANNTGVATTTTIYGNLVIQGTTTTVNNETVNISDNYIVLNSDQTGAPSQDAGIEVERGDGTNSTVYWDEANNLWKLFNGEGSTTVTVPNTTGTVALTSDLHNRSHAMTSTSDHTAGNWKVFYSNGSGNVVELALGSSGTVLKSNGASAAPSFEADNSVTTYLGLSDTPSDFTTMTASHSNTIVAINTATNALVHTNVLDCGTYA